MTDVSEAGRCLNCSAPLHGAFCGACGQRAVPPDPTVRELAGDAWNELTGYDGRFMATLRGVMRPGFLTREYLNGRRRNYLPPVRVYLVVSVLYFVIAASAPDIDSDRQAANVAGPGNMRIGITRTNSGGLLSDADRQELLKEHDTAPWYLRPMMRSVLEDPGAFRTRLFTIMPRVFFALVPVFAAIVVLFYRRHHFPTALVFALHVHVFAFVVFAFSEAAKYTYSEVFAAVVSVTALVLVVIYVLRAFRAVFGGSWPITLAKAVSIGFLYAVASLPAFIVLFVWASLA
jgi:hypothetical protein